LDHPDHSAGQAAVALAGAGHRVHIAVRGPALAASMSTYLLDRITRDERICVHVQTVISELHGARQLESVVLRHRGPAKPTTLPTHYLLAMIGAQPHTEWLPPEVARDQKGFILTGDAVPSAFGTATNGQRSAAYHTCMKRACRACSPRATSGPVPSSGWQPPRAKEAWQYGWSSNTSA
jgi:thioredoxin reductase